MKKTLLTGGCGFIGVNLIPSLLGASRNVRVLDNLTTGRREDAEALGVELIVGDIRDEAAVAHAMKGVDEVIHLAADTRVIDSIEDPRKNFDANTVGTLNLLLAARQNNVRKFVMASTGGAILGEKQPPAHEEMVAKPLSPYGASKLAGEGYCSAFFGSYGLVTVALRFSNVYGPYSYAKASVVAAFYKRLLQGESLVIYGDGNQTRDFLYSGDLVRAVLLALEKAPGGEVFQIASGRETSVNDLVSAIRDAVVNVHFEVKHEPARRGEVSRNFCDITKARSLLGFSPQMDLHVGLRKTWEWFGSNRDRIPGIGLGRKED